jgi:hypothetical protein
VGGTFRAYWEAHGGLAQQGYPLTEEFPEQSKLDGKTYTVQYFERAIFEYHRDNVPPYDVLLSLVGVDEYNWRTNHGGVGDQQPNRSNALFFPQTGHWLGGIFRTYWEQHGGLAQQGYPISDEILSGTIRVQYFQRAVFEYHPENAPPYNILLSLLGSEVFSRYEHPFCKGCGGGGEVDHAPSSPDADFACDISGAQNGSVEPYALRGDEAGSISARGFAPTEPILYSLMGPNGQVIAQQTFDRQPGETEEFGAALTPSYRWVSGRWVLTLIGTINHRRAILPFCIYTGANTHVWPLLKNGATGPLVQAVQLMLRARGYDLSGTGNFLNYTEAAVTAFQTRQGLSPTGKVDVPTWDALLLPLAYGDQGDAVRALQSLLAPDFPDNHDGPGVFGADTLHALNEFETRNNLPAQQTVDREVWYQVVRHAPATFR